MKIIRVWNLGYGDNPVSQGEAALFKEMLKATDFSKSEVDIVWPHQVTLDIVEYDENPNDIEVLKNKLIWGPDIKSDDL